MLLQLGTGVGWVGFPPKSYGGVECFIYEVCKRLSNSQSVVEINGTDSGVLGKRWLNRNFLVYEIPVPEFDLYFSNPLLGIPAGFLNNAVIARRLYNLSELLPYDTLHLHESKTGYLHALNSKKPKVFTFHGSHTAVAYHLQPMYSRLTAWDWDAFVAKRCSHMTALSGICRSNIQKHLKVSGEDISVVHYGVDHGTFKRIGGRDPQVARLGSTLGVGDGPVLMCITRLARDKGIDLIVEAVGALKKKYPGIKCFVCGFRESELSKNSYGRAVWERILEKGLHNNIKFLGKVPHKDLPRYLALCDVFLHPARAEAFGLAVAEAMACEKPVVCLKDSGGPDDMIGDGKDGFLLEQDDAQALAGRIGALLEDNAYARSVGRAARRKVIAKFTWEHTADKLGVVYEKISKS